MSRSLISATFTLVVLTGCQTLITSPSGIPSTERVTIDHTPVGSPLVRVIPNSSQTEWTIVVSQTFGDTQESRTVTPQKARRYLLWPLAPLNGLIQCPLGALLTTVSSSEGAATMREVGCMRLAAMEPLANTTRAHTVTERHVEMQQLLQPVTGTDILFVDRETHDPIHTLTDTNGRATLRGKGTSPLSGTLTVSVANQIVLRQDITIAPQTTMRPHITIPIPTPVILQVTSSTKTAVSGGLEDRLRHTLLTHGFSVLPPQYAQDAILDEHSLQMAGKVKEETQISTGRLLRPTLVISATQKDTGSYAIRLLFTTTGQQQELELDRIEEIGSLLANRN
jgi:hypothetical protein